MVAKEQARKHRRFKRKLPRALTILTPHHKHTAAANKAEFVVNLSSHTLTTAQLSVLEKGLSFIPTSRKLPDLDTGTRRLTRTLRLDYFFNNTEDTPLPPLDPFRRPSGWQPPKASKTIESYIADLPARLQSMPTKHFRSNITRGELEAIKELSANRSLVIKNADKGSCVVVEDKATYIADGLNHLSDTSIYNSVPEDTTQSLAIGINTYIDTLLRKGHINTNMHRYLYHKEPQQVRTQQLYFLKKLHKGPREVRPIVSGSSGPTEKVSAFIDLWLRPLVQKVPSYLRDSSDLISKLESLTLPADCILATVDVRALYLNIPHEEGITASINKLKSDPTLPFPTSVAREMLQIVLTHNNFEFASKMHKQVRGTAMGTKMAPSYAGLFMAELEERLLREAIHKPSVWLRFIDDIFLVWEEGEEALKDFLDFLNASHLTIKFTFTTSSQSVDFLDVTIHKGERFRRSGILDFQPYHKPTNKFQYLHFHSAHPRSTFGGIAKGELLRMLRSSSDATTFFHHSQLIVSKLRNRGYPVSTLSKAQQQVTFETRDQALAMVKTPKARRPPFIVKHSDLLSKNSLTVALKPPEGVTRPLMCFQRDKNLKDKLVRARLPDTSKPTKSSAQIAIRRAPSFKQYSSPCGTPLCECCRMMSRKEAVFGNNTSFKTPHGTSCDSCGLIYLLQCTRCDKKNGYVGQTGRNLRARMAGHRRDFNAGKEMPIYRHLRDPAHGFGDLRVTILELVRPSTQERLLQAEKAWMTRLDTRLPKGLNSLFNS